MTDVSPMIERVARAIARERTRGLPSHDRNGIRIAAGDDCWTAEVALARAAIEALREPSGLMLEGAAIASQCSKTHWQTGKLLEQWRAMIDAALSEKP